MKAGTTMATYRLRDVYIVEYDVVADSLEEALELGSPEDTYPHAEYYDTMVISITGGIDGVELFD